MNKKTSSSNNAAKMSSLSGQRTWHGMGTRAVLVALLGFGLLAHTASGEVVLFSDNFTVSANSYNDNFENTLGRQSGGTLGVINYTAAGSGAAYTQVGHSYCPGAMLLAGGGATSPDHNFTENPGIGGVSFVRFLADPVLPLPGNQDPGTWMGLTLGTSLAKRNLSINTTDGFAILFR